MYHCPRRSRGVLMKGDARNMFFRKDCSYQRMLEKCTAEADEECENAKIDVDDGTEELEWTLNRYIQLSKCQVSFESKILLCPQR